MRPTHRRSLGWILAGAVVATGCGKDSNGPGGDNAAPTAAFTWSCTDLACSFTDGSSDTDGSVMEYSWQFGDGEVSGVRHPSHTYGAGNSFTVTLTVTDNAGDDGTTSKTVTVTAPQSGNGAPVADFEVTCSSQDCTFDNQSTDPDGNITSWVWNFGDGATSTLENPPSHHYDVTGLTSITVTLTVTDASGLTSTKTQQFTVSPPATLQCESAPGTGQFASCDLVLLEAAAVRVTLEDRSCDAHGDTFQITAPIEVTLLSDGCYSPAVGHSFNLADGTVFPAGTHIKAQMISGAINQLTAPALHVTGSYPTWTLAFDDGVGGPGEPDFNDLTLSITALP
jgi:PKD repeat protein